jgi:hypothetical protein
MGTIRDLNELAAANLAIDDYLLVSDTSDAADRDKKMKVSNLPMKWTTAALANRIASWKDANTLQDSGVAISGTGTLAMGAGNTLTVPATGTAALLGTAQTFTALQTLNAGLVPGTSQDTFNIFKKGTWIVGLVNHGSATTSTLTGDYIRIGGSASGASIVFFSIISQFVAAGSGAGALRFTLPFPVVAPLTINIMEYSLLDLPGTGAAGAIFETEPGNSQGICRVVYDTTGFANILGSNILANALMRISGFYFA